MAQVSQQNRQRYIAMALLWSVITLLVFSLLVKLGLWQLSRAEQKTERLARIEQLASEQVTSLRTLLEDRKLVASQFQQANDRAISLTGRFASEHTFYLDNQIDQGRFGYRILQVFEDYAGASVLVNLGWVPGDTSRQTLPRLEAIQGEHNIQGTIRLPELTLLLDDGQFADTPENNHRIRIQQLNVKKMSQISHQKLLPFVVYLDKKETLGYKKNWQAIVMPPEKHQGYAFQWFSLAIAWLLLMIFFARRSLKCTKAPVSAEIPSQTHLQ